MKANVKKYFERIGHEICEENFEKCFDSSKVSDHHGIIPTLSSIDYDFNLLKENEIKVFKLIKSKFMASCSENLIESITKGIIKIDDFDFVYEGKVIKEEGFMKYLREFKKLKESKFVYLNKGDGILIDEVKINERFVYEGKVIKEEGFMKYLREFKKLKESKFVYLNKGDGILIDEVKINERYTTPPKHYTDDTLLKSMENAGKVEVESERKGLGTPATRAGIIEGLILKRLVERKDKNLIPTKKGISLITIVCDFLKSEDTTSQWESKLYDISKGVERKDKNLIPTKKGISLITIVCDFLKSEDTTSQWESKLYDISKGKLKEIEFLDLISNEIKSIISMYNHVKNS